MNIPILTLTLENMRQTVRTALMQHTEQVNEELQKAVDRFCTSENLASILDQQAAACIKDIMQETVKGFFNYHQAGRQAIREAVLEKL